jgi:hypothetical protein
MARLVSRLSVISTGAEASVALALHDTANFILVLVRLYAPVDTGWLRDSYKKESLALLHILIGSMVNYSLFQEYGTARGGKFTPHLRPAFWQSGEKFKQAMKARLANLG